MIAFQPRSLLSSTTVKRGGIVRGSLQGSIVGDTELSFTFPNFDTGANLSACSYMTPRFSLSSYEGNSVLLLLGRMLLHTRRTKSLALRLFLAEFKLYVVLPLCFSLNLRVDLRLPLPTSMKAKEALISAQFSL